MSDAGPPPDYTYKTSDEPPPERGAGEKGGLADHLQSKSTWLRLFFMLLFGAIWAMSRIVIGAVVVVQFFWLLLSGTTNARLTAFGQSLATYTYQVLLYLTFNTEQRPWPFADWPHGPPR